MQARERSGMRVLMTADAIGGVWSYALDLSRILIARGVEVVLAVMGPAPTDTQRDEAAGISNLELRHRPFDLEWFQGVSGLEITESSAWLRKIAREHDVDLVHLNGYAQAAADWEIPVLVVAHSCVYSWWKSVYGTFPPDEYRIYKGRLKAGLRAASAVVAPSAWMLQSLQCSYGVPLAEARVIHNFTYAKAETFTKESFILASGRFWDVAKNLKLLDGIAPQLPWPVEVAGELEGPEGVSQTTHHLTQAGWLSRVEMAERFARASIFAHPARYEPFGLAVLEAAASGCALVLSDIGPLRELWEGCALFASPDEPALWIEALTRLTKDERLRTELARAARRKADKYTPDAAVDEYLELYERLIGASECNSQKHTPIDAIKFHELTNKTILSLHRF